MSEEKPQQPASPNSDPRLKSFLRQAGAIITTEKGLNSVSRVKLQSLANRLKLPRSLFDEALQRLQTNPEETFELTRYEKAFVKFLDSEFEKLSGGVLSLGMEKNAIDLANRKYQINNARAEQLIQAQAESAGISRISPSEASAFAEQTIVDQIGELAAVEDELNSKLQRIGKKWGLSADDIDRLVSRQLTINRSRKTQGREKTAILMLVAAVVLGGLGSAYALGMFSASKGQAISPPPESQRETPAIASSWVPRATLDQLEALGRGNARLESCAESIQSDDLLLRQQGYQALVRTTCELDSPDPKQINTLIAKLFFLEPEDETAFEITRSIHEMLAPVPPGRTLLPRDLEQAYRANRLLGRLLILRLDSVSVLDDEDASRIQAVEECIRSDIGIPVDKHQSFDEYLAESEEVIASDQWNQLIESSWTSPASAALLVEPLYELTQTILKRETLNEYRDESLLSIMKKDSSRWRELRGPISQSLQACDDNKLSEWILVYTAAIDESLQDMLGDLLLKRIDVEPKSRRRNDVVDAIVAYGMQYRYRLLQPVINRNALIDQHYSNVMDSDNSASILPDRIAQMALAVNVEFAFCVAIENATHLNDSTFLEFDRLINTPLPRLRELISLPIDRRRSASSGPISATASDERRKTAALQRLGDLDPQSSGLRILALSQLERVAHRFERISYADAVVLADYFFASLSVQELLEIESRIEAFSHWPNLALAMADKLPEKNVEMEQALTITRLLLSREFQISENSDWKNDLRLELLTAIETDLENQIDQDPDNIKSNWIRLKLYLIDAYRQRQAIVLNQDAAGNAYLTPFQATIDLVDGLVQLRPWKASNLSLQRATRLVRQSSLNEIEKSVFANQLLILSLSTERSGIDESKQVLTILSALQDSFRESDLPGEHLYATERTLFELIDLKRKSLVDQLLERN